MATLDRPEPDIGDDTFVLLDAYLQDLHAGRQPDRERLLHHHPELEPFLMCLEGLDRLVPGSPVTDAVRGGSGPSTPVTSTPVAHAPGSPAEVTIVQGSAATTGVNGSLQDFGNFELLGEIGRGGMGVIWKARQKDLDRVVAIKMILANHLASQEQVERFVAEARIMARLHHPHIVRIHETGQVAGQHYFVMEYIAGQSLADRVRIGGPLSPEKAAQYVCTIARAVEHLHAQGIVHRDLKPSNVLLDEHDRPYVTDFGLVKMLGAGSQATTTGAILGTPAYMAPEQAAGRAAEVGPLSDVYSLGAILYDLLIGRPPFQGETPLDTLLQVMEGEPTRPRWLAPKIPTRLEMIVLKCLEKNPADRYSSAAALADDLERFLNDEEVEARPAGLWPKLRRWVRREPALAVRLCALVILTIIVHFNYVFFKPVPLVLHAEVIGLMALWMGASVVCQRLLRRPVWGNWVPALWSAIDAVVLTMLLHITESQTSPLLIGFPLLVAASGLWFQVRPVWVTTLVLEASYALTVIDSYHSHGRTTEPHYHIIFMVALAVLGFIVAYQVQRMRVLSRYYEHRQLP
jgi:tRNA A-37 threonylcarbamoyl transferase component Bud32